MVTPAKHRIGATIKLVASGLGTVHVTGHGLLGSIVRCGIEHYRVITAEGTEVGVVSRYEPGARLLAKHHGLREKHTIAVRIVRSNSA